MVKTITNIDLALTEEEKQVVAAAINTMGSIASEYTDAKNAAKAVSLDPMVTKAVEALRDIIEALSE